jgi:C1A family cysteine protease
MARPILFGTGWVPDPPDDTDVGFDSDAVRKMFAGTALHAGMKLMRKHRGPLEVDLRRWCSPVHFQGYYNTCTTHVVTSMIELLENRAHGSYVPASRLFLYQVAKRILGESGDPGVYLRQMMGSVVLVGVPPEKFWPYLDTERKDDPRVDAEPDAFCYAMARDFGAARYFRLDTSDAEPEEVQVRLQVCLTATMPVSIGFTLYGSALSRAAESGEISMPAEGEAPVGSHAVLLVGFDDAKRIGGEEGGEGGVEETTGAFLFKNSWGDGWGEKGYGWLPYRYLSAGLAKDCWTMMQSQWIDTAAFQFDLEVENENASGDAKKGPPQPPIRRSRSAASATRSRSSSPPAQNDEKAR